MRLHRKRPTAAPHPLACACPPAAAPQGSSQGHWRFPHHAVEQGYAYILTHPGTPCVFWDHLLVSRGGRRARLRQPASLRDAHHVT